MELDELTGGVGGEVLLRLAAAALAGSRLRVSNVFFVVVKRYYVSSWICSRSRGTKDSAFSSKPPLCSFLACVHFKRHNAIEKAPQYLEFTVNLFTHSW